MDRVGAHVPRHLGDLSSSGQSRGGLTHSGRTETQAVCVTSVPAHCGRAGWRRRADRWKRQPVEPARSSRAPMVHKITASTAATDPEITSGSRPAAPHASPAHTPATTEAAPLRPAYVPSAVPVASGARSATHARLTPSVSAVYAPYTGRSTQTQAADVTMPSPRYATANTAIPTANTFRRGNRSDHTPAG